MKLLKEKYRTWDGAHKRCGFENGIAKSEYERGYKARLYRYTIVQDETGAYRVAREVKGNRITTSELLAGKLF